MCNSELRLSSNLLYFLHVYSGKPLGKGRRWLSHYDILSTSPTNGHNSPRPVDDQQMNQERLDITLQNADAMLAAAKNNTRFLSEVEKMSLADGMLGSGSNSGSDSKYDSLEKLRWYVYQQECADALRDGLDEVPFTFDNGALLGGVMRAEDDDEDDVVDMELEPYIKAKFDSAPSPITPSLLSFQEGDHTGEASFEEIKTGYDDGELSDECVIFHHASDEWIPIKEFIQQYGENSSERSLNAKKRDLSAMKENSKTQIHENVELPSCEEIHSATTDTVFDALTPAAEKREKKKPSRDNSQWGQCSAPHLPSSTASSEVVQNNSLNDEKKIDCPNDTMNLSPSHINQGGKSKKQKTNKPPPKMMRFITQVRCYHHIPFFS